MKFVLSLSVLFSWLLWYSVPPTSQARPEPLMRPGRIPLRAPRQIIAVPQASSGSPWSLYLSRLEDATRDNRMVRSLFVQIGVLNLLSLITVSATGVRESNVWLTLAMPRGPWLRINRYRGGLSKSPFPYMISYPAPSPKRWWNLR